MKLMHSGRKLIHYLEFGERTLRTKPKVTQVFTVNVFKILNIMSDVKCY